MLQHSAFVHEWYEMSVYPSMLPSLKCWAQKVTKDKFSLFW